MKKLISCVLSMSMLCSAAAGLNITAEAEGDIVFKHQNIVGSQTCYSGTDLDEKTITEIPDVIQGMRINQPVFRVEGLTASKGYTVKQKLKDGTVISEETVTANDSGILEFKHVRNCEMIEILDGSNVVASIGTEREYVHGVAITYAPMSWQVYQRDENDEAEITIKGELETGDEDVTVEIDGAAGENVDVDDNDFTYTITLPVGQYTITVKSGDEVVAEYENVAVGDVWVAAGQSNMTDMGAITDGFVPDTQDPIDDDMHIIYAEDTTWQKMSHPAGEGRFFKTGVRTSPVTSFAREISDSEGVPVGIVQSSVGGTNIYQWVKGVRDSDDNSGYLIAALKSCFDKMPSHDIKGILWYQGCNDAINENYAYNYKNLQQRVFDEMHEFFGEDTPIITTQINDANQDSNSSLGYYDAWSYVKDIQRQNEDFYDNVYIVGTGELELGDTIHNNAASNVKLGAKWARVAKNVVYGDSSVSFRQPTIDTAKVTGTNEITLTFKNTNGLKAATGQKRIGITNGGSPIALGDLTKEFVVRKGGNKVMTASNSGKGTELTITNVEIVNNDVPSVLPDEDYSIERVIKNGSKITNAVISQKAAEETGAQLIIAQYSNDVLLSVKAQSVTLGQGENNIPLDVSMADEAEIKVMLWDSLSGMTPLAESRTDITAAGDEDYADSDGTATVIITTEEELSGVVAVDCMYGKRFSPTLVDAATNESVLAFYNVIAEYDGAVEVTPAQEITASDTAYFKEDDKNASDEKMYVNKFQGMNAMALMKFNLTGIDLSKIVSAKLAVYTTDIDKDRSGNITISEITTDWNSTAVYGDPNYTDIVKNEIRKISTNTAGIFPVGNYSDIDITDYLQGYEGGVIGIGISSDYASVATIAGVNSNNPPRLIIQPGHTVELTYTAGGAACEGVEVTIEGVGATDYAAKTFTTDANGKIKVNLTEGEYRATTETVIGGYMASSNTFTVESGDVSESYTLTANTVTPAPTAVPTPVPEETKWTFGDSEIVMKPFDTSSMAETAIGTTGFKAAIAVSGNYNNAVVRNKAGSSASNTGYYPYGSGLPDRNSYYLFLGSGGNGGGMTTTLTLPNTVEAGKYIKITYAKPYATNNGSTNRSSANNADTITIGSEVIDLQNNCEFDTWYTTIVKADTDISSISVYFGAWSAACIESIEVLKSADTMELIAEDNITEKYITPENQTVKYNANVYKSVTMLADSTDILSKGGIDEAAAVTYSVSYDGVSIDANGILTITPSAQPGTVTVTASYGGFTKSIELTLLALGNADAVEITGEELAEKGKTYTYTAIPKVDGITIPERATEWSIEGDAHGCSIDNGVLTVPADAVSGNITIKATLKVEGVQTTANVSNTYTVTIKGDEESPYRIGGVFLTDGTAAIGDAAGVDGIIVDVPVNAPAGCKLVVKAIDAKALTLASDEISLDNLDEGVQEVKANVSFKTGEAALIKAYITDAAGVITSDIYTADKNTYKNVPLVSDWITGAKSGLGMGAGIMAPTGAPYGVDPELVDVTTSVNYTYDNNYHGATADNVLWYKTGAYATGNSNGNNSIYARDGVDWEQQALPIGNGYMGGMLFGLPGKDQIQINEETFWAAGYRGTQTSVSSSTVNSQMSEGINGYMSVGNIFVDFGVPSGATVKNYYRDLNLDESVAHVRYEYDGVKYSREYFASYPKEVLAFRYTAENGDLNFTVNPVSMHPGEVTVNNGEITIIGKLKDSEPYSSGGNAAWNQESDLEYCTKIKVIADDGEIIDGYNKVTVSGATDVTILVTAATDYDKDRFVLKADGSVDMTQTPYKSAQGVQAAIDKATRRMNGAAAMSYDELKAEHIADYKSQFDKVTFSLTDSDEICNTPTNELQASYNSVVGTTASDGVTKVTYNADSYAKLNKHLEELHFNYARYMMISSSRSNTMPATLQGKWCQSTAEIWGSCYCININMEMNYWFAGGANLLDSGKSLIGWFNSQIPAGRVTAKNMYKVTPKSYTFADGKITFTDSTDDKDDVFIMHTKQAIMGTTDMTGSTSIQSPGNTAWLMYNLWDLYQTSGDKDLLANELYPIMRKAANFYTQYLYNNERKTTTDTTKYPDGYYYTTWSGRSPEQGPTHEGIKYDLQLVAGMYDYTIAAAETLGVDADKVAAWKEIRNHLELPVELGDDGQIKEWAEETKYNTDASGNALGDPVHRHISHLVGLYPGTLINRDTPELLSGAKIVLENRGDDSTGWSCSNKFLLWARTLEGDKALELFRYQLAKKTYANLFDTHSPFQIDGNFGSAAGVMELLMQSQTGDIYILPALPTVWDKGEISGIKAKNGAEVSIKWSDNKATEIKITPAVDGDITIGCEKDSAFTLNGADATFTNGKYTITNAKAGTEYVFISK